MSIQATAVDPAKHAETHLDPLLQVGHADSNSDTASFVTADSHISLTEPFSFQPRYPSSPSNSSALASTVNLDDELRTPQNSPERQLVRVGFPASPNLHDAFPESLGLEDDPFPCTCISSAHNCSCTETGFLLPCEDCGGLKCTECRGRGIPSAFPLPGGVNLDQLPQRRVSPAGRTPWMGPSSIHILPAQRPPAGPPTQGWIVDHSNDSDSIPFKVDDYTGSFLPLRPHSLQPSHKGAHPPPPPPLELTLHNPGPFPRHWRHHRTDRFSTHPSHEGPLPPPPPTTDPALLHNPALLSSPWRYYATEEFNAPPPHIPTFSRRQRGPLRQSPQASGQQSLSADNDVDVDSYHYPVNFFERAQAIRERSERWKNWLADIDEDGPIPVEYRRGKG